MNAVLGGVLLALAGQPALAQQPANPDVARSALQRLEGELGAVRGDAGRLAQETRALRTELDALSKESIRLAAEVLEREALADQLAAQLNSLAAEQVERRAALEARRRELAATLGALARLARTPSQAYFLYPGEPLDAVRGAVLLRAVAPSLAREAEALSAELEAIDRVEQEIATSLSTLRVEEEGLARRRAEIETLNARKLALLRQGETEQEGLRARQARLTKEARDLRALLDRFADEARRQPDAPRAPARPAPPGDDAVEARPAAPSTPRTESEAVAAARARVDVARPDSIRGFPPSDGLNPPVHGRLVQRYGQDSGLGQTARGITVETRPLAQVVAPYDGRVVFAGPFRDFGRILILEHSDGYHSLLAGLGGIGAAVGQWVLAGEPVGQMGDGGGGGGGGGERPRLYVELRKEGRPVNPLNWIAAASLGREG